jgi:hypothetical protein
MWSVHRGDQYMLQELGSRDSGDHFPEVCPNGEYTVTAAYAEERSATVGTQPPGQEHQTKMELLERRRSLSIDQETFII